MTTLSDLIHARRSVYHIGTNTEHTAESVADALRGIITRLPSAMNSQTTRLVVVSGDNNTKVWDSIHSDQKGALSPDMYERFAPRFTQAKQGLGTVLLFESRTAVENMGLNPARSEIYKENNHAITALAVWLQLTELGLGTSLQHFNVGYESGIRELLGLPDDFEMLAQMPFGSIETPGADKPALDPNERVILA
ncbi:nitroreductase family protein [Trueperella bialowiezensis]|uniref:Nitroreductase family n=1 Tax=Trueperella bialowiezensis TaxID=312285 RepID=A0A3S4Z4U8_9ACTO|nr:nitroreductase family protein [Trueperella bialowiezensis]VEI12981.1 Nitroreductase family [Trueperella bialowiezensis]